MRFMVLYGLWVILAGTAMAQGQHWGAISGYVQPPSPAAVAQAKANIDLAQQKGMTNVGYDEIDGVLYINGMVVYEAVDVPPSEFPGGAWASYGTPVAMAFDADGEFGGFDGEIAPDCVECAIDFAVAAIHESYHAEFNALLDAWCMNALQTCVDTYNCHVEDSGHKCNEAFANAGTMDDLCADIAGGNLAPDARGFVEEAWSEAARKCCDDNAMCAQATVNCGPLPSAMAASCEPCEAMGGLEPCGG